MADKSDGGRRTRAALAAGGRRATRSTLDARNALPALPLGRRGARKRSAAAEEEPKETAEKASKKQKKSNQDESASSKGAVGKRRRRVAEEEDEETKGEQQEEENEEEEEEEETKDAEEKEAEEPTKRLKVVKGVKRGSEEATSSSSVRSDGRASAEEEEETKGGEEETKDGEVETKGGEAEDAREPGPVPEEQAGGRARARVVAADTDFVRALVAARERMESAPRKMVVWDEIAATDPARFRNGRVAKGRLEWLQIVRHDRFHAEHSRLTQEMTKLLGELETAAKAAKAANAPSAGATNVATPKSLRSPKSPKKRKKIGFTDPVRQRRLRREALMSSTDTTAVDAATPPKDPAAGHEVPLNEPAAVREVAEKPAVVAASGEIAFGSPLVKLHGADTFDATAEENLMQLVLDSEAKFRTGKKLEVWGEIAAATQGKYLSGKSAKNHVWWVLRSLRDPSHRVSKEATPKLREMVQKYEKFHANLPDDHGRPSKPVDIPPRAPSKGLATSAATDVVPVSDSHQTLDVASDKLLVVLVSEKISRRNTDATNEKRWEEIAHSIRLQNPAMAILCGADAKARLKWLLSVVDDATHVEHRRLTPYLRKILDEYKTKAFAGNLVESLPPTIESVRDDNRNVSETVIEDAPVDENGGRGESLAEVNDSTQAEGRPKNTQVQIDEELIRLVLQWRPSHLDRTSKGIVWAKIVDALQDPKITNGLAAHSRVRWLLNIYHQPKHAERSYLSDSLKTMLKEYSTIDDAAKADDIARVLSLDVDVSGDDDDERDPRADPNHGLLLRELLRLRPFHAKLGSGMGVWKQVASRVNRAAGVKIHPNGQSCLSQMKRLLAVVRNTTKSEIFLTKRQRVMLLLVDALLKIRWPKNSADINDGHKACLEKIQRLLDGQPDHPRQHVPQISPTRPTFQERPSSSPARPATPASAASVPFAYEYIPPTPGTDPVDALHTDIARFRETAARDRASREEELAKLREQITACRTQLSGEMDTHDEERRAQRNELQSVMALLKDEREMHARENALVLQVVQKERDDRRQEFGTLVNLATCALLGRTNVPPSA